jgi:hypothetical protein
MQPFSPNFATTKGPRLPAVNQREAVSQKLAEDRKIETQSRGLGSEIFNYQITKLPNY